MVRRPVTLPQLQQKKQQGEPITMLTAWDYLWARLLDAAGVDMILVGDSLGMVALGYPTTLPVTLDQMIHHAQAVRRGVSYSFLVVDLPFLSYQESPEQALRSAGRLVKEAQVQAVKMEGASPVVCAATRRLVEAGIPVLGHVGLLPQQVHQLGGWRQQGNTPEAAEAILRDALALAEAGAFGLILEHIPADLAQQITAKLEIPTIGIGAGPHCDGQVLVTADILGLSPQVPPFAKVYADLGTQAIAAVQTYCQAVKSRQFPLATPANGHGD
ncbi:3-methyl-2-oxobutanoate hydroxymethyltransferase [Thermosynechococcus sp.]|uniref:3-methyl-2-oxobutanoate hydroxymethyltransferase n=1 Tax=Thermosynechococcus sp. TaxID=2814275 RepID=UPI00391B2D14